MKPIVDLVTREPFSTLFPRNETVLDTITKTMVEDGFNQGHPIHVWADAPDGGDVVLDGHHRLEAAKGAGLEEVPVHRLYFATERQALEYAIAQQRDRRNMPRKQQQAHVVRAVAALDRPKEERLEERGGDRGNRYTASKGSAEPLLEQGRSADRTAEIIGTSPATVKRIRTVLDSGDEETKADLLTGKITPAAAAKKVSKAKADRLAGKIAPAKPKKKSKLEEQNGFRMLPAIPAAKIAANVMPMLEVVVQTLETFNFKALGEKEAGFRRRVSDLACELEQYANQPSSYVDGEAPSDGLRIAKSAAGKLNEIRKDDLQRAEAYAYMRQWIDAHDFTDPRRRPVATETGRMRFAPEVAE
jgi:ParB-like chromosome segregation protein Spo0J